MQTDDILQSRGRFFYGWWVLFACILGLSVGPGQFAFGSLGLFITSMQDDFGWSRSEISLASTIFTTTLIFFMPLAGRLVDRFGSREVAIPAMFIVALSLALLPLLVSRLWHLYLIFFCIGSLGAAANSLPFMLAISAWFDRRRGIAIGIAMAGSGLGYAYVPPLVQHVNSQHGWHAGYYTLAAIIVFIAIPLIYVLMRNTPAEMGLLPDGATGEDEVAASATKSSSIARHAALRSRNFWMLFTIFSLLAFCLFGLLLHIVPLLTDRGMSAGDAAVAASTIGITIMVARVLIGYLMDRVFAPYVALASFLLSALGIAILATGASDWRVYVSTVLIGFSIGAEVDLLAYLAGRYFGLKHFGEIYGLLFASMMIGVSLGPYAFGLCFDISGNYTFVLVLSCVMIFIASIITGLLPAYPDLATHEDR